MEFRDRHKNESDFSSLKCRTVD